MFFSENKIVRLHRRSPFSLLTILIEGFVLMLQSLFILLLELDILFSIDRANKWFHILLAHHVLYSMTIITSKLRLDCFLSINNAKVLTQFSIPLGLYSARRNGVRY